MVNFTKNLLDVHSYAYFAGLSLMRAMRHGKNLRLHVHPHYQVIVVRDTGVFLRRRESKPQSKGVLIAMTLDHLNSEKAFPDGVIRELVVLKGEENVVGVPYLIPAWRTSSGKTAIPLPGDNPHAMIVYDSQPDGFGGYIETIPYTSKDAIVQEHIDGTETDFVLGMEGSLVVMPELPAKNFWGDGPLTAKVVSDKQLLLPTLYVPGVGNVGPVLAVKPPAPHPSTLKPAVGSIGELDSIDLIPNYGKKIKIKLPPPPVEGFPPPAPGGVLQLDAKEFLKNEMVATDPGAPGGDQTLHATMQLKDGKITSIQSVLSEHIGALQNQDASTANDLAEAETWGGLYKQHGHASAGVCPRCHKGAMIAKNDIEPDKYRLLEVYPFKTPNTAGERRAQILTNDQHTMVGEVQGHECQHCGYAYNGMGMLRRSAVAECVVAPWEEGTFKQNYEDDSDLVETVEIVKTHRALEVIALSGDPAQKYETQLKHAAASLEFYQNAYRELWIAHSKLLLKMTEKAGLEGSVEGPKLPNTIVE